MEIIYEAKCKHCAFHKVSKRKTFCTKKQEQIRLKDTACNKFEL